MILCHFKTATILARNLDDEAIVGGGSRASAAGLDLRGILVDVPLVKSVTLFVAQSLYCVLRRPVAASSYFVPPRAGSACFKTVLLCKCAIMRVKEQLINVLKAM